MVIDHTKIPNTLLWGFFAFVFVCLCSHFHFHFPILVDNLDQRKQQIKGGPRIPL